MTMERKIQVSKIFLKIVFGFLGLAILTNFVMRTLSYSFYQGDQKRADVKTIPQALEFSDTLTGYGHHLDSDSKSIILCFGGSFYPAYNVVGLYGPDYDVPFMAVDYYGTQASQGKMNLQSMQASAEGLYDWAIDHYPDRKVVVIGHSYGCGMAAYLASVRSSDHLFLLSGYRDLSDLYNRMVPIFWGPLKFFITDDIKVTDYAQHTDCPVTILGSEADKTLGSDLQRKLADAYEAADFHIFKDIDHDAYLSDSRVIDLINHVLE